MYKCLKSDFQTLEKRINAICKKLDKNGLHYVFEKFPDTVELVKHYKIDPISQVQYIVGIFPHAIANYNFEMEPLKIGDWQPIAVIEHSVNVQTGANMVFPLIENLVINPAWAKIKGNCEHCNSNRIRAKTVIMQDAQGNQKQVGTTCIKDFTGIDAWDIIHIYVSISAITEEEPTFFEHGSYTRKYISTADYLAHSIDLINETGYSKESTKFKAFDTTSTGNPSISAQEKAKEIINFFSQFDSLEDVVSLFKFEATFYWDIAQALQSEFSKINGLIAYAPIAYTKAQEVLNKQKSSEELKKISQWQGKEGQKVDLLLEYISSHCYETSYNGGYSSTVQYIHLFKDEQGNIFKWSTANLIEAETGTTVQVKGTIKRHSEYKGEKQTELTRCKVK